jgi:hypothetical protein
MSVAPSLRGFLEYPLDPVRGHLGRGREPIPLWPRAYALLYFVLDNRPRLLDEHELLDAVGSEAAVNASVLANTIKQLRRAPGADPGAARTIETVQRTGSSGHVPGVRPSDDAMARPPKGPRPAGGRPRSRPDELVRLIPRCVGSSSGGN